MRVQLGAGVDRRRVPGAVCAVSMAALASTELGPIRRRFPADLERIFEVKLTEVMSIGCASLRWAARRVRADPRRGQLLRCGLGMGRETGHPILLIRRDRCRWSSMPTVCNAFAGNRSSSRPQGPFVLPHAGEMGRVAGPGLRGHRREAGRTRRRAPGWGCPLRGHDSIVTDGERPRLTLSRAPNWRPPGCGRRASRDDRRLISRAEWSRSPDLRRRARAHTRLAGAGDRVGHDSVIAGDVIDDFSAVGAGRMLPARQRARAVATTTSAAGRAETAGS